MKLPHLLDLTTKQTKSLTAGILVFTTSFALFEIDNGLKSIRNSVIKQKVLAGRRLSVDLGEGNCEWREPLNGVPDEYDFEKTLVAGFPSG